jgi:hypothetical protein
MRIGRENFVSLNTLRQCAIVQIRWKTLMLRHEEFAKSPTAGNEFRLTMAQEEWKEAFQVLRDLE